VQAATAAMPGLPARLGAPDAGAVVAGRDNRAALQALVTAIAEAEPDAGRGFWALRAWGMLIWQPAMLTLLGVQRLGLRPDLEALGQSVQGPMVWGFQIPAGAGQPGDAEELLTPAAGALRAMSDRLLEELNGVVRVKPELARRLLADRLLGLILYAEPQGDVEPLAERWLQAAGLQRKSGLMRVPLGDGGTRLALERRACCLEYRGTSAAFCATCPKLALEDRHARLRAQWAAERPSG
jgi:siderophore ferric iron reductase